MKKKTICSQRLNYSICAKIKIQLWIIISQRLRFFFKFIFIHLLADSRWIDISQSMIVVSFYKLWHNSVWVMWYGLGSQMKKKNEWSTTMGNIFNYSTVHVMVAIVSVYQLFQRAREASRNMHTLVFLIVCVWLFIEVHR